MFILAVLLFIVGMALLIDRSKWSKGIGLLLLLAAFIALMVAYDK
jgi:multisubunit Na+/H+ antiporter MnhC subunit